jgi:hypothetical protein
MTIVFVKIGKETLYLDLDFSDATTTTILEVIRKRCSNAASLILTFAGKQLKEGTPLCDIPGLKAESTILTVQITNISLKVTFEGETQTIKVPSNVCIRDIKR